MSDTKKKRGLDRDLLGWIWPFLEEKRNFLIGSLVVLLMADVLWVGMPWLIKHGIDENIRQDDLDGLMSTVGFLSLMLLFSFLFRVTANYAMAWLGQHLLFAVRMNLFRKLMRLPKANFDITSTGTRLTNVTNDVEAVRQFISEGVVSVLSSFTKLVLIVVLMFVLNGWLALVTLFSIPIFVVVTLWFKGAIREGNRRVRQANSDINTRMVESLNGYREIVLFQHREANEAGLDRSNRDYLEAYRDIIHAYSVHLPLVENITHLSTLALMTIAHVHLDAVIEPGDIIAFFTLIAMFFRPLREMAEQFNTFQSALAALERIVKLSREEETVVSPPQPKAMAPGPLEIDFDEVEFSYLEGQPVLQGLSLKIHGGETVALVGGTGAGKSTVTHLINRLYDIQKGHLRVGGQSIGDLDLGALRSSIATIPQDVFLYPGTLYENITLFDESIERGAVEKAIEDLGLQDFVQGLSHGLDTHFGEGGDGLSIGQKQLVAFARAWVKQPRCLILDEATANVDSRTEALMESSLQKLREGRTTILIAHRLSTIRGADRILVLHHGKLHEEGDHKDLLKKSGLYARLYEKQALSLKLGEPA